MFGVFTLMSRDKDKARMLGFRNSVDKTLVVGLTAGTRVFVCDNLAFSGEFVDYHKHISILTLDGLRDAARRAISEVTVKMQAFAEWQEDLKTFSLARPDAEALTF